MKTPAIFATLCVLCAFGAELPRAQGRGAPDWTTVGADAQRSSWVKVDPWISIETMAAFEFLWKLKLDNEARQSNALTAPATLANLNSFRGLKSLALVGGSANNVYAIDYDFGTVFWKTHFNYSSGVPEFSGSPVCPGGMTMGVVRPTSLVAASQLSFLGFARPPRPAKSEVGEPGKGAPQLVPGSSQGGRETPAARGAGPPAAVPAAAAPPQAARGRAPNAIFAVTGDGIVHALNPLNGDAVAASARLLAPNAAASGLIFADGFLYAVTSSGCGNAPDAVWAMDWDHNDKAVVSWESESAPIAGPALGMDGTLYVAVREGTSTYANSIVALEAKTLRLKDWFTRAGARFTSSPVVFDEGIKTYVAAAGEDANLYVLDADAVGGSDHRTPVAMATTNAPPISSGLATWRDARGTRWIAGSSGRTMLAFRFTAGDRAHALEPAWTSTLHFTAARTPIIVNGVMFVLSSGNQSTPAVLYALNPDTGGEIWNSGSTITSFATAGLSAGTGQAYVVTHDNTVWSFGIPLPK